MEKSGTSVHIAFMKSVVKGEYLYTHREDRLKTKEITKYKLEWTTVSQFDNLAEKPNNSNNHDVFVSYLDAKNITNKDFECNRLHCRAVIKQLTTNTQYFFRLSAVDHRDPNTQRSAYSLTQKLTTTFAAPAVNANSKESVTAKASKNTNMDAADASNTQPADSVATDALNINLITAATGLTVAGSYKGQCDSGNSGLSVKNLGEYCVIRS